MKVDDKNPPTKYDIIYEQSRTHKMAVQATSLFGHKEGEERRRKYKNMYDFNCLGQPYENNGYTLETKEYIRKENLE